VANSAAHDIALYLAASGVGTYLGASGWAINHDGEGISPDNFVTVYNTGGQHPETDELDLDRPTIQVRVRAVDLAEGYAKLRDIRDLLIFPQPIECDTSTFRLITITSDMGKIGNDAGNRHILTANFDCWREITEETT